MTDLINAYPTNDRLHDQRGGWNGPNLVGMYIADSFARGAGCPDLEKPARSGQSYGTTFLAYDSPTVVDNKLALPDYGDNLLARWEIVEGDWTVSPLSHAESLTPDSLAALGNRGFVTGTAGGMMIHAAQVPPYPTIEQANTLRRGWTPTETAIPPFGGAPNESWWGPEDLVQSLNYRLEVSCRIFEGRTFRAVFNYVDPDNYSFLEWRINWSDAASIPTDPVYPWCPSEEWRDMLAGADGYFRLYDRSGGANTKLAEVSPMVLRPYSPEWGTSSAAFGSSPALQLGAWFYVTIDVAELGDGSGVCLAVPGTRYNYAAAQNTLAGFIPSLASSRVGVGNAGDSDTVFGSVVARATRLPYLLRGTINTWMAGGTSPPRFLAGSGGGWGTGFVAPQYMLSEPAGPLPDEVEITLGDISGGEAAMAAGGYVYGSTFEEIPESWRFPIEKLAIGALAGQKFTLKRPPLDRVPSDPTDIDSADLMTRSNSPSQVDTGLPLAHGYGLDAADIEDGYSAYGYQGFSIARWFFSLHPKTTNTSNKAARDVNIYTPGQLGMGEIGSPWNDPDGDYWPTVLPPVDGDYPAAGLDWGADGYWIPSWEYRGGSFSGGLPVFWASRAEIVELQISLTASLYGPANYFRDDELDADSVDPHTLQGFQLTAIVSGKVQPRRETYVRDSSTLAYTVAPPHSFRFEYRGGLYGGDKGSRSFGDAVTLSPYSYSLTTSATYPYILPVDAPCPMSAPAIEFK